MSIRDRIHYTRATRFKEDPMVTFSLIRRGCFAALLSSNLANAAPVETGDCNVERLGDREFGSIPLDAPADSRLELRGWIIDSTRTTVPFDLSLYFASESRVVVVPVRHRVLRPDVVAHFGNENLMLAGFS